MIVYVESKLFQFKTFTLVCHSSDTIARARAHLLHILHELDKNHHQFRLRYKGEYLRDCHTFDEYGILDNSVLKMVPMARTNANLLSLESNENVNTEEDPLTSIAKPDLIPDGHLHEIHKAVIQEVEIFKRRENLLEKFKAILWIHFLATLMAFSTYFWYSGFWSGALMLFGLHYCPTYSRSAGFVGRNNISNNHYLTFFGVGSLLNCIASTAMSVYLILEIQSFSCGEMESTCTRAKEVHTWSVVLYVGQALFLLASLNLDLLLYKNFHYEVGDIIVDKLVQSRDLEKVLRSAKLGGIKERRNAALEMVSLIASNIETKMTVVNEGGLQVLINLALSTDSATQEYATEAIAEMLTVPEIQGHFVEVGGIRTLSALLQSNDMRVVTEAVTAMSYIVAYNEANKLAFIAENGLNDLSHVSTKVSAPLSRIVAGMFLELAFSSEIRYVMSLDQSSVQALLSLSKVEDRETLRLSLQTLELLAIENPVSILDNSTLLLHLLSMAKLEEDEQLYLLVGKIMLYYASDESGCKKLIESGKLKATLTQFSHTTDTTLQTVIAKIIFAVVESYEDRNAIVEMNLGEVLLNIRDTTDNAAWEMIHQALAILKDIALSNKKSDLSTILSDDGSGPSTSGESQIDKSKTIKKNDSHHSNS